MHSALRIQEILSVILDYCSPGRAGEQSANRELAALARTCRTFKELALDVLWRVLSDLSPLARCLPQVSHKLFPVDKYSFTRPLSRTEWDILQGYTHRIRVILDFNSGLDWGSVTPALNLPLTGHLFPRLRVLRCDYTEKTMPPLRLPLPALNTLNVTFKDSQLFRETFESFPDLYQNIEILFLSVGRSEGEFGRSISNSICRWRNLRILVCPEIALGADALARLSSIPALTQLAIALSITLPVSNSLLTFSKLRDLTLRSMSLQPILRFLSWARLPAITEFSATINRSPSRPDLVSFLADLSSANAGHTVERLQLIQSCSRPPFGDIHLRSMALPLGLEDFRPWMAFHNLSHLELNVECNVHLTNSDVLAMASAWPRLGYLLLNEDWGWNSGGGITLDGLVQLLRTRRSLTHIVLRLDTRGYTEVPQRHAQTSLGLTLPPKFSIDVVDSSIETESVGALTTFFSELGACCESEFCLYAWGGAPMVEFPEMMNYMCHWYNVRHRVGRVLCPKDDDSESIGLESYEKVEGR